jgi:transcriptional regulator with XRE-family HTH domain
MDWASYIRDYRKRYGLKQADFAAIMGVEQATVSRWETGLLRPGVTAQRRLREKVAGFNTRADRAIINSVRLAGTMAGLVLLRELRYLAVSEGVCRLNGARHDTILGQPFLDIISERGRQIAADRAVLAALLDGNLLAIRITDTVPRVGGGRPHLMSTTVAPLWLSDGTPLLREDSVLLSTDTFREPSIEYIGQHERP